MPQALAPTFAIILGPPGAGKTTLVRGLINARPAHEWTARQLGMCAWLAAAAPNVALLGHWRGWADEATLPSCTTRYCGPFKTHEGADQLRRQDGDYLLNDCARALATLSNQTRLVVADGNCLIQDRGSFDARLIDLASAAGFRVRLMEIGIDEASHRRQRIQRDGAAAVKAMESWMLRQAGGDAEIMRIVSQRLDRVESDVRADRRWRLCAAAEIGHALARLLRARPAGAVGRTRLECRRPGRGTPGGTGGGAAEGAAPCPRQWYPPFDEVC